MKLEINQTLYFPYQRIIHIIILVTKGSHTIDFNQDCSFWEDIFIFFHCQKHWWPIASSTRGITLEPLKNESIGHWCPPLKVQLNRGHNSGTVEEWIHRTLMPPLQVQVNRRHNSGTIEEWIHSTLLPPLQVQVNRRHDSGTIEEWIHRTLMPSLQVQVNRKHNSGTIEE